MYSNATLSTYLYSQVCHVEIVASESCGDKDLVMCIAGTSVVFEWVQEPEWLKMYLYARRFGAVDAHAPV